MKRVLIVEDDAMWAAVLTRYASGVDAEVRTVVSGGQAMDMIDSWRPDALVLDMLLAGETGMALLNELRSHDDLAKLPAILCTSVGLKLPDVEDFYGIYRQFMAVFGLLRHCNYHAVDRLSRI